MLSVSDGQTYRRTDGNYTIIIWIIETALKTFNFETKLLNSGQNLTLLKTKEKEHLH